MGQRSQMFVQVQPSQHASSQSPRREGRHYQWVWGPHMIVRAAQVVRLLETATETKAIRYWSAAEATAGIIATYSVNQATGEVQGLSPYDDVSGARLEECDNNNGALLVHVDPAGESYSFAFLIGSENDGDLATVTGVEGLMAAFTGYPWHKERTESEALEDAYQTLLEAEDRGHLMDQATADDIADNTAQEDAEETAQAV